MYDDRRDLVGRRLTPPLLDHDGKEGDQRRKMDATSVMASFGPFLQRSMAQHVGWRMEGPGRKAYGCVQPIAVTYMHG